ncbi:acyl carrier protein [Candidatus Daviesbacteria bacterium]|nr:acyl carrier protein [Candidatus Daviesbacteria bacterium]
MNDQTREIVAAIAKHLGVTPQDIDTNSNLETDLGLGPLERADLLSELSNKFNITFDPTEIEEIETVSDLVVIIEDLLLE